MLAINKSPITKQLYTYFVKNNQKAIIAFVLGFVGTYLAKVGVTVDMTLADIVTSTVTGVITSGGVYFQPNK